MSTSRKAPANLPDLNTIPMSEGLRALVAQAPARHYPKGRVLIQEGDTGASLFVVLSGGVRAYSTSDDGTRSITYGDYFPGEFLGELSLDGGPRSASVMVCESGWVANISRQTVEAHLAKHPEFAFELLSKVIRRARAATVNLRAVALNDVYGRIVWLLNSQALEQPDGTRLVLEAHTHQSLADRLACTRPMVSRVFKELAKGGYLVKEGAQLRLLKPLPQRF